MSEKACKRCGEIKPLEMYARSKSTRDGHIGICKPCEVIRVREWKEKNPEKAKAWFTNAQARNEAKVLPTEGSRVCNECGKEKHITEFGRDSQTKDGIRSRCKICNTAAMKARYHAEPEKHREKTNQWRAANPERNAAYMARYQDEHREERNAHRAQYRLKNRRCYTSHSRRYGYDGSAS